MDATALNNWMTSTVTQVRESVDLLVPDTNLPDAWVAGAVLLAIGLFLGIYGAVSARAVLSALIGGVGYLLGAALATHFDWHQFVGGIIGFGVLAAIAYLAHRFWIGIAVGIVVSSVGLCIYGHDSIWPDFLNYEPIPATRGADSEPVYQIPSVTQQDQARHPDPVAYIKGFVNQLRENQPQTARNAALISAGGLVIGFIFGVWCTRWALILCTSLLGTVLFSSALASFAEAFASGGWEQRLAQHPNATLGFIATCFVLSALVQMRTSRAQSTPQRPPT